MPVTTRLATTIEVEHGSTIDLGTAVAKIRRSADIGLTDGTAAGQANRVFADRRTLAASANEDLDLAGTLTDSFGVAVTFARIKGIYIAALDANTNNVIVGAAASNAWATLLNATGTATLRPGGYISGGCSATDAIGWAVTAGTADLLRIANSGAGTSVTYDIVIVGASV